MYQPYYEEVARYGAEGDLGAELLQARAEYKQRTGEMFESDASYERRIGSFLEWYVLDRKISFRPELTPAELFVLQKGAGLSEGDRNRYAGLAQTRLSLFEFKKAKAEHLVMRDIVTGEKIEIFERRRPAGLDSGDVLEGRIVPWDGLLLFSDVYFVYQRDVRKEILSAAKRLKKAGASDSERIAFVHRVAFLETRAERYKHLDARKVFAELNGQAA